jgi:DNA anti-recombination protein RmuC
MRTLWSLALAVALIGLAAPARAQQATPERPGMEDMRRRIRERVAERIQQEMQRLRATVGTYANRRRELQARQRTLREALGGQLRPGIAAMPDSVARLTDELADIRVHYAESFRAEQREMAKYLDPVQRAKITLLRDRLANRAQEFRRRRALMEP